MIPTPNLSCPIDTIRGTGARGIFRTWYYLTQGTAGPLKVAIVEVHGAARRDDVLRDLIWSADLCFTKVDMGLRLPWVLHVADAGALQSGAILQDHRRHNVTREQSDSLTSRSQASYASSSN